MSDPQFSASQDVEMHPAPSEPTPSSSATDPASSLRAAALLTLKSKRRKPQSTSPSSVLPPRPPPTDATFHLDYGQEENTSPARDIPPATPVDSPKPPPTPEAQTREEGEISDEESPEPATVQSKLRPATPVAPPLETSSVRPKYPTPSTSTLPQIHPSQPKPKLSERISDPPGVFDSDAHRQGDMSDYAQTDLAPAFEDEHLDADHVRPGVALNQIQYDRAKDNVLDLLGWGVHPEYLVDCGLTREIVYYVFSELNLRLPQNLDTTGLIPYTPGLLVERRKSALMPPPPTPQVRRYSNGHLNLSSTQNSNFSPPSNTSPAPLAGSSPSPATPSTTDSPKPIATGNLHDMEQQRRQELLARKAAIASRKSKPVACPVPSSPSPVTPVSSSSLASSNKQDVEMAVPTETVDDFLKTIGPTSKVGDSEISSPLYQQPSTDDMDVDEIPGLGSARQYKATASIPSRSNSIPPPSADAHTSPTQTVYTPMSPIECPPSSTESASTTFTQKSGSHTPSDTPGLPEGPALQRRGAKRPVAADFVDLDTGSRPSSNGSGGYTNGMYPGSRRRMGAGFANVSSSRRFIIDLSDSDGEADGDVTMRDKAFKETGAQRSAYESPVPIRPSFPNLNTSNGWATPPVSMSTPTLSAAGAPSGTMSPAVLLEKEIEIQKMRELIAQREQRRLNKMAAAKVNTETSINTESVSVTVKREETFTSIPTDNGFGISSEQSLQPLNHEWHMESATGSVNISGNASSRAPASATPPTGSPFSRLLALPTPG